MTKLLKKEANSFFLFIFVFTSTFLLSLIYSFLFTAFAKDQVSEGLISSDCRYFIIEKSNEDYADFSFIINDEKYENISLLKAPQSSGFLMYEVIYSDVKHVTDAGRDFKISDFINKEKVALVGADISEVINKNINIYNNYYENIGELSLDRFVIFYTNGCINKVKTSGIFVLDGVNKKSIDSAYSKIATNLQRLEYTISDYIPENSSLIPELKLQKTMLLLAAFFSILHIISLLYVLEIWHGTNRRNIAVRYMIGFPYIHIQLFAKYLLIHALSVGIPILINYLLFRQTLPIFPLILDLSFELIIQLIYFYFKTKKVSNIPLCELLEELYE